MAESKLSGAALVIGGGIGGVQSALDLADAGYKVYLVERQPGIGGVMAMLDKTFPTNDCSMCILSPKLVVAARHRNIELLTLTEVLGIEGEAGDFTVRLLRRARYVNLDKCTGCGDCLAKCPVKLPNDFEGGLSERRAIYRLYAQAVPNAPMIDAKHCLKLVRDKCGACAKNCKAGAIEYGQQDEEVSVRVGAVVVAAGSQVAPTALRREYGHGRYPNVVTSLEFERILSASGPFSGHVQRPSDGRKPERIAWLQCVGSRDESVEKGYCSAMCCMYAVKEAVIAREHMGSVEPTVFYMDMRSYGKDFDRYVERAEKQYGVRLVRARVPEVREDQRTRDLVVRYASDAGAGAERFDMVVLSCGLVPPAEMVELGRRLDIKLDRFGFVAGDNWDPVASSRPGISVAGSFQSPMAIPETVTGASGAAAAVESVLAEVRGKDAVAEELPPERDVRGEAPRIGAFICHCGVNIGGVVDVPAVVEHVKTLPFVVYADENLYSCSGDTQERLKELIREHRLNRVMIASCSPRTHEPLFQATLAEAGLNPHLFAMANIRDQCSWVHMKEPEQATAKARELVSAAIARVVRQSPLPKVKLPVKKAALVLGGGIAGLTSALAIADEGFDVCLLEREAELGGQALSIFTTAEGDDVRARLKATIERTKQHSRIAVHTNVALDGIDGFVGNYRTTFHVRGADKPMEYEHGVVVVATGAEYRQPTEYQYGASDCVITQRQLEEMVEAYRRNPKTERPGSVVMIQCVGSREPKRPWCSRICCAEAVKNAIALKELNPETEVHVLYRDIRTYGLREEHYRRARGLGVVFIRYTPEEKPEVRVEDGRPIVTVRDPILGRRIRFRPDILALSSGIVPRAGAKELAMMLKVPLNADGFFLEAHMKLRPVDFATEGVYMAGLAHFPKFIDEAVAQARAAAGRAATVLSRDTLEAEATVAHVDRERCTACRMCETLCAYRAIEVKVVNETFGTRSAVVNEALCKGCGACAANCRCSAIDIRGFTNENICRELTALLD
ncbi:MAG TPA: CoB--CoM heterodisulfide reductase iron-sulfur subunit A family protein [candidate division WOR-3 bacterium]|uniref:CoB--CoM heterodisulfide reductase iron-sulfur subunit A family protein n=1 Tax=candidate division WOR-3 bacterium TaxID=2052148 RepID=A0A7V0T4J3_UNCW3|nr:CoB--CoM heterodisulfide reductase iron-sulfur subunit A family protein [candidate division WOR-3 bacterium]